MTTGYCENFQRNVQASGKELRKNDSTRAGNELLKSVFIHLRCEESCSETSCIFNGGAKNYLKNI